MLFIKLLERSGNRGFFLLTTYRYTVH